MLAAGCGSPAQDMGAKDHLPPPQDYPAGFVLLTRNAATEALLEDYGFAENPGLLNTSAFPPLGGVAPQEVAGLALRKVPGAQVRVVMVFAMTFADPDALLQYVMATSHCDSPMPPVPAGPSGMLLVLAEPPSDAELQANAQAFHASLAKGQGRVCPKT